MRLISLCLTVFCLLAGVHAAKMSSAETRKAFVEGFSKMHVDMKSVTSTIAQRANVDWSSSHQKLSTVHESVANFHAAAFHSMNLPSVACAAALYQLNATIYSSTCASLIGTFSNNPLSDPATLAADITSLCTSTCLQSLATASAAVASGCQSTDAEFLSIQIQEVVSYSSLLCTKDPANANQYCFVEFYNAFLPIAANTAAITNAELAAFCIPCTYIIVNGFVSYGALSLGVSTNLTAVSLFCSTDSVTGQFCVPEMQSSANVLAPLSNLIGSGGAITIPKITNAEFEPLCSSCTKKFVSYAGNPVIAADLAALCVMSGTDFCFVKDLNNLQTLVNAGFGCAGFIPFANAVGCCINPLISLIDSFGLDLAALFQVCNYTQPLNCPVPQYTGTFTFVILNIQYSYYVNNSAAVNAAIIADVANNLGLTTAQISITSVVAFTGGVQVTASIQFTSSLESTTAIGGFTSSIKASNFPLVNTAQLGPVSRIVLVNPVATSTTNAQATSNAPTYTTVPGVASASAQQASSSLILLAIPILALIFAKN